MALFRNKIKKYLVICPREKTREIVESKLTATQVVQSKFPDVGKAIATDNGLMFNSSSKGYIYIILTER